VLGILKDLGISRATGSRLLLGGLPALILHLRRLKPMAPIVTARPVKSRLRLNRPDTSSAVRIEAMGWGCVGAKQIRETLSWQPRFDDLSGAPDQPIQRIQRIRN
jgi:hypothetical protein